ncbi:site-specific recombinase [Mesorhizobium sp. 113-3-3]|nr:site-specific recombinase [Mesorhizobium sp. 113-3-3]
MKIPSAYSYIRWSSDIQADGDSNRRQTELAGKWCEQKGIQLAPENILKDEGISAFRGKNLSEGSLGGFLASVKAGKIEPGSYLLVESVDRLSRQEPLKTLAMVIFQLLEADIVIVTLDTGKEYRNPINPADVFLLVATAIRANEESETKRKRNVAAWKNKRDQARSGGKKLTKICPAWMYLNETRDAYILIPSRVAIVQRIYRMSMDGLGIHKITQTLNRERVEPFNGGGKASKNPRKQWAVSSVNSILQNRAVFGEFQMKIRTHEVGTRGKANDGEPIQGYYPVIITEGEYNASAAIRNNRRTAATGRKGETHSNLFTGMAFCSECGGKMHQRRLGTYKSKNPEVTERYRNTKILYCSETVNGNCTSKSWDYTNFENSFLTFMRTEVDVETIINGGTDNQIERVNGELQQLEGERQVIESKVSDLLELDGSTPMASIKAKLAKHDERLQWIIKRAEHLNRERAVIVESRRAAKVVEFKGFPTDISATELYDMRAKTAQQIRSVVERVELYRPNLAKRVNQAGIQPPMTKESDSRVDRNYMVRFKGGAARLIYPDGGDAFESFIVKNMGFGEQAGLPKATRTSEEFAQARAGR